MFPVLAKELMRNVILEHVAAEDAINPARVVETYSANAPIFEDVAAGVHCVGGEEIIAEYRGVWDGFPKLSRNVTRWTFGEDSVVIEVTVSGKHEGFFRDIPPTSKEVTLRGIAHFQFDSEGRIKKETVYYDSLTLLRQLGIIQTG